MTAPEFPLADALPDLPDAACRTADPAVFFADGGSHTATQAAKTICRGCPEIEGCLRYAVSHPTLLGVWAATTADERKGLRGGTSRVTAAHQAVRDNRQARVADARLYAARGVHTNDIASRLGVTPRAVERYLRETA